MSDTHVTRASYVFVSDEGRVVGIALRVDGELRGVCLALLRAPVTLSTWLDTLRLDPDPEVAASKLVKEHGGIQMRHVVNLPNATFLPILAAGIPGEA